MAGWSGCVSKLLAIIDMVFDICLVIILLLTVGLMAAGITTYDMIQTYHAQYKNASVTIDRLEKLQTEPAPPAMVTHTDGTQSANPNYEEWVGAKQLSNNSEYQDAKRVKEEIDKYQPWVDDLCYTPKATMLTFLIYAAIGVCCYIVGLVAALKVLCGGVFIKCRVIFWLGCAIGLIVYEIIIICLMLSSFPPKFPWYVFLGSTVLRVLIGVVSVLVLFGIGN